MGDHLPPANATFHLPSHLPQGKSLDVANDEQLKVFGTSLLEHLKKHGHALITGFPVQQKQLDALYSASADFFALPEETKKKYAMTDAGYHGYVANVKATENAETEDHEGFNISGNKRLPEECPQLRETAKELDDTFGTTCQAFIRAMALVLGFNVKDYMSFHQPVFKDKPSSVIRVLHYPEIPPNVAAIRIKEHTDWSTLTFGFQSNPGGLQIRDEATGEWSENLASGTTAVLFCGEYLSLMTCGAIPPTLHRAILTKNSKYRDPRRSIIYFCALHEDAILTPSTSLLKEAPKEQPVPIHVKEQNKIFAEKYFGQSVKLED